MKFANSKGERFFGLHFYSGVAEYQEKGSDPYRVYLNENTLREMDATFEGRPVFVRHVDDVNQDVDELRKDADGWVVRSFYNSADGKHWCEFIVVTEKGMTAIKNGWKLSNSYFPKAFGSSGLWNGVAYQKEITGGEYEHLAIVPNPRYDESVVMTPEEFKKYNERHEQDLKKLNNEKERETMAFKLFKRAKVDNAADFEEMSVMLPKSGKEVTLKQLVNDADEIEANKDKPKMANMTDTVEHEGKKFSVKDMMANYGKICDELKVLKEEHDEKKENEDSEDKDDDKEDKKDNKESEDDGDEATKNALAEAEAEEQKLAEKIAKLKNELGIDQDELEARRAKKQEDDEKKKKAKEKAERLKNASADRDNDSSYTATVDLPEDRLKRGVDRYGTLD